MHPFVGRHASAVWSIAAEGQAGLLRKAMLATARPSPPTMTGKPATDPAYAWPAAARRTPRLALWACCPRVACKPTMAFLVAVVATTATSRRHSLSRRWPMHAARFAAICRRQRQLRFGRKQSPTGSPSCRQPLGVHPSSTETGSHDEATRAAARGADARVATTRLTPRKSCARISRGTLSHGLLQAFAAIGGASRWVAGATIVARSVVLLEVLPRIEERFCNPRRFAENRLPTGR